MCTEYWRSITCWAINIAGAFLGRFLQEECFQTLHRLEEKLSRRDLWPMATWYQLRNTGILNWQEVERMIVHVCGVCVCSYIMHVCMCICTVLYTHILYYIILYYITTTATYTYIYHHHHHHHQKTTTTQCKLPKCKSGICTSGWKEKHHRCKLQRVQVESLCQHLREKHYHRKLLTVTTTTSTRWKGQDARCKGQDQHQRKLKRDAGTTYNSNHHHHWPPLVECTMQQSLQLA